MAKKPVINKTQAVADYLKAHPKAKASEITQALGKQGIMITAGHAANIKSKIKRMRRAKKSAKTTPATSASSAVAVPTAKPSNVLTLQHVRAVACAAETLGGFGRLNELLEVIREVGGLKRFKELSEAMAATGEKRAGEKGISESAGQSR
jgi:hypothetical protein